jgi:hypothetical protein
MVFIEGKLSVLCPSPRPFYTCNCLLVQRQYCFFIETDTTCPFTSFPSNTSLFIDLIVECCNMFLLLMFAAKPSSNCVLLIQFAKSVVSSAFYLANRMHSRDDEAPSHPHYFEIVLDGFFCKNCLGLFLLSLFPKGFTN